MNEYQNQRQFLEAAVNLQRLDGKTVITRKELVAKILTVNPQSTYGTSTPFGANFTHHLRDIARTSGGKYIKDKKAGRGANARLVFKG